MDWKQFILEIVRAIVWPATVLTLGLVFRARLIAIAREIEKLLPRLREASPAGLKFADQVAQQELSPPAAPNSDLKPIAIPPATKMIGEVETNLLSELTVVAPEKRVEVLVRQLAKARLVAVHERVFAAIFGSQIALLRHLSHDGPWTKQKLEQHYQMVGFVYGEVHKDRALEMWIGYLIRQGLVTESDEGFHISDLGRDFLEYIAGMYPGVSRPG